MDSAEPTLEGGQSQAEHFSSDIDPHASDRDRMIWANFAEADNTESFCLSWLAIQCRAITGVSGALVLLGRPNVGPFTPVAVWPDVRRSMEHLTGTAQRALTEHRGLLVKSQPPGSSVNAANSSYHVAYPLEVDSKLHGVIVLDVSSRPEPQLQAILRQLHWGSAWLEVLLRRQESQQEANTRDNLITVLDLLAGAIEQDRFYASALAFVTELATRFSCHRVSIGFLRKNYIAVEAVSHSAQFEKKTNLISTIGSAMDESFDQNAVIVYPQLSSSSVPLVTQAHEQLAHLDDTACICTIPLYDGSEISGALTFERATDKPFDPEIVEVCEAIAAMAGPALAAKRKNDRPLVKKIVEAGRQQLLKLTGPQHVGFKLVTGLVTILLVFFIFADGNYRVSARTAIEGQIQRVVATPFPSYIIEANVRAGDTVEEGDILAVLDDRDLKLEHLKAASQREQLLRQYREVMAEHDRPQIRITMAQLSQVNAQLELLNYQLARTKVRTPFAGVIMTGDFSQSLGAPVEKGQVLFEIAPLDSYRVILQVDERDIADVGVGQGGKLTLSSIPGDELAFTVVKITPVSTADEGRTYFRVEAHLDGKPERLRPGMEGVGKINIDRRKQIWIWTHGLVDWLRLWLWSWWP